MEPMVPLKSKGCVSFHLLRKGFQVNKDKGQNGNWEENSLGKKISPFAAESHGEQAGEGLLDYVAGRPEQLEDF
ncbi:hypothetical protein RJ639_045412 [Escallonia herrerae]|uniref:Uncharacterized protein n=1 Tax=Escallonia herrerae TaxID=1293975 RepID=A0AA88W7R4_9ASTE|nr:hypothetical protein RJ639_045412 [Escallonia herrerae]